MEPGSLTLINLVAPTIFVLGVVYILGPLLPIAKGWARYAIFAVVWSIAAWYLHWRLFVTMLPAEGAWYELGWLWFCFAVELLSIFDQLIPGAGGRSPSRRERLENPQNWPARNIYPRTPGRPRPRTAQRRPRRQQAQSGGENAK